MGTLRKLEVEEVGIDSRSGKIGKNSGNGKIDTVEKAGKMQKLGVELIRKSSRNWKLREIGKIEKTEEIGKHSGNGKIDRIENIVQMVEVRSRINWEKFKRLEIRGNLYKLNRCLSKKLTKPYFESN